MFAESFEQRTENPRVENLVITSVNMHPEGSDLIGAFYKWWFFIEGDIPVLFSPDITGNGCKKYVNTFDLLFLSRTGEDQ